MIVTRGYGSGAIVTRGYSAASDYEFLEVFFRHIWPAKYDPLTIAGLVTSFNIAGLPYIVDITSLPKAFWAKGLAKIMYIKGE